MHPAGLKFSQYMSGVPSTTRMFPTSQRQQGRRDAATVIYWKRYVTIQDCLYREAERDGIHTIPLGKWEGHTKWPERTQRQSSFHIQSNMANHTSRSMDEGAPYRVIVSRALLHSFFEATQFAPLHPAVQALRVWWSTNTLKENHV